MFLISVYIKLLIAECISFFLSKYMVVIWVSIIYQFYLSQPNKIALTFNHVFSIVVFPDLEGLTRATGFSYRGFCTPAFQNRQTNQKLCRMLKAPNNTRCLQAILFTRPFATFSQKHQDRPSKSVQKMMASVSGPNKYTNWSKTSRVTRVCVFTHAP